MTLPDHLRLDEDLLPEPGADHPSHRPSTAEMINPPLDDPDYQRRRAMAAADNDREITSAPPRPKQDWEVGTLQGDVPEPPPDQLAEVRAALREGRSYTVWREGLGFVGTFDQVELRLGRIHDGRDGLRGELAVRWLAAPAGDGHLHRATFSLSSMTARSSLAKYLAARAPGAKIDWTEVLERFCIRVLDLHRGGADAFERVGRLPQMPVLPRHAWGRFEMPRDQATLVYAPQGARKSTLARAVLVGTVTGSSPLPDVAFATGPVLVLDWETWRQEWNDGTTAIARGAQIEPPEYLYRRCNRPLADMVEEIALAREREGAVLVVVDSVQKAAGATRDGGTYEESAQRLFEALDLIGGTSLLVDHVAGEDLRNGAGRAIVKPYGSAMKIAWARAAYELRPEPDAPEGRVEILLRAEKLNVGPKPKPYGLEVVYDGATIRFQPARLESEALLASLSVADRMVHELRAGPLHEAALAKAIDAKEASVRSALRRHPKRFVRLPDARLALVAMLDRAAGRAFDRAVEHGFTTPDDER